MKKTIRIEKEDNVAVVAQDSAKGDRLDYSGLEVVAGADIPLGHKVALAPIGEGQLIVKFGVPIGRARADIRTGEHVHVHNVEDITTELCEAYEKKFRGTGA